MRRLLAALGLLLLAALPASAQMSGLRVVASCGTPSPWPALATSPLSLASSGWLTVDTNYNLCTNGVFTGTVTANSSIVNWGGGVLGAMANYGTSPGAVLVPGVNAFITNTPAMNLTQVASTALGAITTYGTSPGAVNVPSVNAFVTNPGAAPPNDVVAGPTTFTGTNTGTVAVNSQGSGAVGIQVTGSSSSYTITFEATVDNTNWFSVNAFTQAGAVVTSTTTTGNWVVPASGYRQVRANLGTHASGTIIITVNASAGSLQQLVGANGIIVQSGVDPCSYAKKSSAFFNITSSGASFITAVASQYVYICEISVTTTTQTNFSIIAGTGSSVCTGGSPYPLWGNPGVTAANGANIGISATVGGGIVVGNGGSTVAGGSVGGTVNYNICALIGTTNSPTVNGTILYVQTAS